MVTTERVGKEKEGEIMEDINTYRGVAIRQSPKGTFAYATCFNLNKT